MAGRPAFPRALARLRETVSPKVCIRVRSAPMVRPTTNPLTVPMTASRALSVTASLKSTPRNADWALFSVKL